MYNCNPESIDPFIVPESIKAYRVWRFTIQNGFHAAGGWNRNRTWSDFNDVLPWFWLEQDFMKHGPVRQLVEIMTIMHQTHTVVVVFTLLKSLLR